MFRRAKRITDNDNTDTSSYPYYLKINSSNQSINLHSDLRCFNIRAWDDDEDKNLTDWQFICKYEDDVPLLIRILDFVDLKFQKFIDWLQKKLCQNSERDM